MVLAPQSAHALRVEARHVVSDMVGQLLHAQPRRGGDGGGVEQPRVVAAADVGVDELLEQGQAALLFNQLAVTLYKKEGVQLTQG